MLKVREGVTVSSFSQRETLSTVKTMSGCFVRHPKIFTFLASWFYENLFSHSWNDFLWFGLRAFL